MSFVTVGFHKTIHFKSNQMQPVWANADLIPHVCNHITDVHCLAALSTVNKAINSYLFSVTGGKHWISAGRLVCGEDYWGASTLEQSDPRYLTKIRICPWISVPEEVDNDEQRFELGAIRTDLGQREKQLINRLNRQKWAPSHGVNYGPIQTILKVHDGVFIATTHNILEDRMFAYFVSSKDLRLLRDRFDLTTTKPGKFETWSLSKSNVLHLSLTPYDQNPRLPAKVLRFGIRQQDKALAPMPEHKAPITQAFWSAFRGEIHDALEKLNSADLASLTCHSQTLAEHVIMGGSLNALRTLLEAEPRFLNYNSTIMSAIYASRDDMAMLIASKLSPEAMCSSDVLCQTLADDNLVEKETGMDINLLCAQYCNAWMMETDRQSMPAYLRLLCSVCASIPSGKRLANAVQDYYAQQNREEDDDGLHFMKKNKVSAILELLNV